MKVAHFDCFSGISGDMVLGALIGAGVPQTIIREGLDSLGLPMQMEVEETLRGAFAANRVVIHAPEDQPQRFLKDIREIIQRGNFSQEAKLLALRVFERMGEAESAAHGIELERVHFHEVGALDSIADIVGSAIGLDWLKIDEFSSRPVPTGHGSVRAAHGIMPVPTPATATLLKGAPLAPSPIASELTTPTGAAILTTVVTHWLDAPLMRIEKIGYGAGTKDFPEQPNVLRLFVGESVTSNSGVSIPTDVSPYQTDEIWLLETLLDDVSGEVIGYCFDQLLAAGVLDVFTIPIQMKKLRPGVLLSVLVDSQHVMVAEEILFRETGTLGVRRIRTERHKLQRSMHSVQTPWGSVAGKLSWAGSERPSFSPEYEACAKIARENGLPIRLVMETAARAYQ